MNTKAAATAEAVKDTANANFEGRRPQATLHTLGRATNNSTGPVRWAHESVYDLDTVLAPGYFDLVKGGLERHDLIDVACDAKGPVASYATLVVTNARNGEPVEVRVLGEVREIDMPITKWWEVLGVDPSAKWPDVERAYKQKAIETHPDKGGSEIEFRQVKSAFEVAKGYFHG